MPQEIDKKVLEVEESEYNNITRYSLQNFPMDSVFIHVYSRNKKMEKLIFEGYTATTKTEKFFYVENSKLYYMLERTSVPDYNTSTVTSENRWKEVYQSKNYFKDNVLIRQLDSEDGGHPFSREYLDAVGESLLDEYNTLILLIESYDSTKGKH